MQHTQTVLLIFTSRSWWSSDKSEQVPDLRYDIRSRRLMMSREKHADG